MSTNRTPVAREPRGRITPEQELALRYGHPPDAFESEAEEAAAWAKHRGSMLHLFARNGHRPIAWWRHDAEELGLVWPGYDREKSTLYEAGALSEPEAAALIMFWREQFDRCHQPGFRALRGARAVA